LASHNNATLEDIIGELKANSNTLGEHTRKLHLAGLVNKKYRGRFVEHSLSPYGRNFVKFLAAFRDISKKTSL